MKKFIKILVGSFTAISVITSTIIAPIEITKNISTSSNINGINKNKFAINNNRNFDSNLFKVNKNQSKNITNIINNSFIKKDLCKNIKFLHDSILNLKNKDQIILNKTKELIHKFYVKQNSNTIFIQKNEFSKIYNSYKKIPYINFVHLNYYHNWIGGYYGGGVRYGSCQSCQQNVQTNTYNTQESTNANNVQSFTSFNIWDLCLNIYLDSSDVSNTINLLNYIKTKVFGTISNVGDAEALAGQYFQQNIEDPEVAAAGAIIKIFGWILKLISCIGESIINSILSTLYEAQDNNEGATIHLFLGFIYAGTSLGENMW